MTQRSLLLTPVAVGFTLALSACVTTRPTAPAQPPAFVEAACGGCHSVEPPFLSPTAAVPSFESIANRPGVTRATIQAWLRNAHNYPEQMDFDLTQEKVEEVADYMITLRRSDYVPVE
ncbi:hypothetical protein INR77_01395 [Erythrobacter sp. SCSIO 43205]|uniref:hypothetical protein n=1 Tax=Erythrobacter sp. SCSIO 43205 TaxID=2779361 RepID=UPI001CA99442|nr:hypothetical protein [Erythrobacter sp. SCSIO 43205]UAB78427.1 hypothetical protein INR77_01395 [Erythrobacter sp. SCSIO 43205]